MKTTVTNVLTAGLLAAMATPVIAEDAIKLRMGTFLPATHFGVTEGSNVFMAELEKLVGDQVDVEFYPASQAGKAREALDLVSAGAIDMYELGTGYYSSSDVPLWGLLEVPNLVKSPCDGTRALRAVGQPGEVVWNTHYAPMGIRVLTNYVYPPYGPAGSRVEVTEVADLEGLKLRNAGGLMERTARAVGGVPVSLTAGEVVQSLQRGTLDSYLGSYSSVETYELNRHAPYGTTGFGMGTPGIVLAINEDKFQSLPADVQDALIKAGQVADDHFCAYAGESEERAKADLQKSEYPMTIHTWTPEQVTQLTEMTANVVGDWVTDLEARGITAGKALEQFTAVASSM